VVPSVAIVEALLQAPGAASRGSRHGHHHDARMAGNMVGRCAFCAKRGRILWPVRGPPR
jgi:hypothetical protein